MIKDYYINGALQMEGTAVDDTPNQEVFEGKVTWYFPDGKVEMVSNFKMVICLVRVSYIMQMENFCKIWSMQKGVITAALTILT